MKTNNSTLTLKNLIPLPPINDEVNIWLPNSEPDMNLIKFWMLRDVSL